MKFELFIEPEVHAERLKVPGNVRQRIKRAIEALGDEPHPSDSRALDTTGLEIPAGVAILRQRLEGWRLVYAVHETEAWVWILAVRRRPPYSYEDLAALIEKLSS